MNWPRTPGFRSPSPGARRVVAVASLAVLLVAAAVAAREWPVRRDARSARRALAAGRYAEALEAADRWLRARPGATEGHYLKVRAAIAQGRRREYLDGLKAARELGLPAEQAALLRALLDVRHGRLAHAEPVLRDAFLRAREPDPQLDEALARVYLETYNFRLAPAVLRRWARDAPDDPNPYLWLAQVHHRTEADPEVLVADYREALARSPNLAAARLGLAEELLKTHRNAEAAREYTAYLALRPDDPNGHVGAGRNARESGDSAAAVRHLDRALELDPRNVLARKERAGIDHQRGDHRAALAHLDEAVRLEPYDLTLHQSRARVLTLLGKTDEALAERLTADRLRTDLALLDDLQTRLNAFPTDRGLQVQIARWMFSHGKEAEGVQWAKKILNDEPGHPETCRLLADYYERQGDAVLAHHYHAQASSAPGVKPLGP